MIRNPQGFSLLPTLIVLGVLTSMALGIPIILHSHFYRAHYEQMITQRDNIRRQVEAALESVALLEFNLANHNDATQNPLFDSCIRNPDPSICPPEAGFFLGFPDGSSNFIGGPQGSEVFYDHWGNLCLPTAENPCALAVEINVTVQCPNFSATSCPDTKLVSFGYNIRSVEDGRIRVPMRPAQVERYIRYSLDLHSMGLGLTAIN